MICPHITALSDHVYHIEAPSKGRFPFCNGFVFKGEETILIDAGLGDELMAEVDKMFNIDTLVISHSHPDHIRSCHALKNAALCMPLQTTDAVMDLEQLSLRYTGDKKIARHWVKKIGQPFGIQPLRKADRRYGDGDIFDIGTARIQAIHAPGHLNDHYCFLDHVSGTLITTDIDFSSFGPWYANPESSLKMFKKSVQKVMSLAYTRACSSHCRPFEGDATQHFQLFLEGFERQKLTILRCLEEGKTLMDMIELSPFYHNKFIDRMIQHVFEGHMISENLSLLVEEGLIYEENNYFVPQKNKAKNTKSLLI